MDFIDGFSERCELLQELFVKVWLELEVTSCCPAARGPKCLWKKFVARVLSPKWRRGSRASFALGSVREFDHAAGGSEKDVYSLFYSARGIDRRKRSNDAALKVQAR